MVKVGVLWFPIKNAFACVVESDFPHFLLVGKSDWIRTPRSIAARDSSHFYCPGERDSNRSPPAKPAAPVRRTRAPTARDGAHAVRRRGAGGGLVSLRPSRAWENRGGQSVCKRQEIARRRTMLTTSSITAVIATLAPFAGLHPAGRSQHAVDGPPQRTPDHTGCERRVLPSAASATTTHSPQPPALGMLCAMITATSMTRLLRARRTRCGFCNSSSALPRAARIGHARAWHRHLP
jgi:hypothetical protein